MKQIKISAKELEEIKKLEKNRFDFVYVSIDKITDNLNIVFEEINRILKPGGFLEVWNNGLDDSSFEKSLIPFLEGNYDWMAHIKGSIRSDNIYNFGLGLFKLDLDSINFINYTQMVQDIIKWSDQLPRDFDCVVGLPRSGLLVATIIAQLKNIPVASIDKDNKLILLQKGRRVASDVIKKLLVVDDSMSVGNTLRDAKHMLKEYNCEYGALYYTSISEQLLDYGFKEVNQLRVFEWNLWQHPILNWSFMDIDGVLCEDPTDEQNDDGINYLKFLEEVKPKYLPTIYINTLITCRLKKYKKQTEDWLRKYNIQYQNLIMMDYPTKEARQADAKYAEFKAEVYKDSNAKLFIESELWQAKKIANLTNKQVLCTKNMEMYR